MRPSTYRHLSNCITSLLLLLSAPIAWGRQEEATNNITQAPDTHQTDSVATLPQEAPYSLEKPAIMPLTAEQQQWLDSYLEKKDSDKKRFKKLLAVMGHEEAYVRAAAFQTAYQLLIDNPALANKRAVKTLRKVPHKAKNAAEARQALQLLYLLVETNPKLALPVSKVVVDLIEGQLEQKDIGTDLLPRLVEITISASPQCLDYLLFNVYRHVGSTDAEKMTVQKLLVAKKILDIDIAEKDASHPSKIFLIALDAYRSKEAGVRDMSQKLLKVFIQDHPDVTKKYIDLFTRLAQSEKANISAMAKLVTLAEVDHRYLESVASLLVNIFQTADERVDSRAAQILGAKKSRGFIVDTLFKKSDQQQAAQDAYYREVYLVLAPALKLLQKLAAIEPAYLAELFSKAQAYMQQKSAAYGMEKQALSALGFVVQHSTAYTPEVVAIASRATQHNNSEVRKATLCLLDTIIEADKQYAQDPTVLANIKKLSHDKKKKVRQLAEELLEKYTSSSNAKD